MTPYEQLRQDLLAERFGSTTPEWKPKTRAVAPVATLLDLLAELEPDPAVLTVVRDSA